MEKDMAKWLTIKDVCEMYKVDRQTVNRWRKKNLPCIKVGRGVRIDEETLIKWIKDNLNGQSKGDNA